MLLHLFCSIDNDNTDYGFQGENGTSNGENSNGV